MVGLKGLGNFTGLGRSRFRWASVVGSTLMRNMPFRGGRGSNSTPSLIATYSTNVRIDIFVYRPMVKKKKRAGSISTGRGDGTNFQGKVVRDYQFSGLQHDPMPEAIVITIRGQNRVTGILQQLSQNSQQHPLPQRVGERILQMGITVIIPLYQPTLRQATARSTVAQPGHQPRARTTARSP